MKILHKYFFERHECYHLSHVSDFADSHVQDQIMRLLNALFSRVLNTASTSRPRQPLLLKWLFPKYTHLFVVATVIGMACISYAQAAPILLQSGNHLSDPLTGDAITYSVNVLSDYHTVEVRFSGQSGYVNLKIVPIDNPNSPGLPGYFENSTTAIIPNVPAGNYNAIFTALQPYTDFSFAIYDIGYLNTQLPVTPISQGSGPWASQPIAYGNYLNPKTNAVYTIQNIGCTLTSLTMAMNYAGIVGEDGNPYDPATLNTALIFTKDSYSGVDDLNLGFAVPEVTNGQYQLVQDAYGTFSNPDLAAEYLTAAIDAQMPVIVAVNSKGGGKWSHYVLVTGYDGDNFLVNDPGDNTKILLSQYTNYQTRGVIAPSNASNFNPLQKQVFAKLRTKSASAISGLQAMYVSVEDAVDIQVVDPQGNVAGVDSTGFSVENIPNSTVFTDSLDDDTDGTLAVTGTHYVYLSYPSIGTYQLKITGAASGSYTLTSSVLDSTGKLTTQTFPGTASLGVSTTYNVNLGTPSFFTGETALSDGVYYLAFSTGNYFGYYSYLTDPAYIYHFDLGYEYVFDANDGNSGVYFYDFKSNDFFYTSPTFPFPYLYDFGLQSTVYYYPDPSNPGHYNTNGIRYFYVIKTGKIISK